MSVSTEELYSTALKAIKANEGQVKDDTYLEKLKTETGKRLSNLGDGDTKMKLEFFEQCGLKHFILESFESKAIQTKPNSLQDFCMGILSECSKQDKQIAEFAKSIGEQIMNDYYSEDIKKNIHFLYLLSTLVQIFNKDGQFLDKIYISVLSQILQCKKWHEESIFWQRNAKVLLKTWFTEVIRSVCENDNFPDIKLACEAANLLHINAARCRGLVLIYKCIIY